MSKCVLKWISFEKFFVLFRWMQKYNFNLEFFNLDRCLKLYLDRFPAYLPKNNLQWILKRDMFSCLWIWISVTSQIKINQLWKNYRSIWFIKNQEFTIKMNRIWMIFVSDEYITKNLIQIKCRSLNWIKWGSIEQKSWKLNLYQENEKCLTKNCSQIFWFTLTCNFHFK